jgi:cytochrome c-type biogenesis protein
MLGDLAFAFFLGLGTFFSPCAVALVPSYLAYYAGRPAGAVGAGRAAWDGLRVGAAAASGVLATFAALAVALYAVRSRFDVPSTSLVGGFAVLGLLIGLAFLVLGLLMAFGRSPGLTLRLRAPKARTPAAMAAWGALFAAGSMGCSLPLALALLARLLADPALAPLLLLAYAAGLGGLLLVLSPLLGLLEDRASGLLARSARTIQTVSGVALAVAGLYVGVYYARQL